MDEKQFAAKLTAELGKAKAAGALNIDWAKLFALIMQLITIFGPLVSPTPPPGPNVP